MIFSALEVYKTSLVLECGVVDKDANVEQLINEINTKYETKLQKISNMEELVIKKQKQKKLYKAFNLKLSAFQL